MVGMACVSCVVWLREDAYPRSLEQSIHCFRASIPQCEIQRREPVDVKAQRLASSPPSPHFLSQWRTKPVRMQPRATVPFVVLAVHVRARLDQRQRRLRVAVQ